MAFTVTPTSGAAPYLFEADFLNKDTFNTGLYVLEFRTSTSASQCPTSALEGNLNATAAIRILNDGVYTSSGMDVPSGVCRAYGLYVRLVSDNSVVSSSVVNIDNL